MLDLKKTLATVAAAVAVATIGGGTIASADFGGGGPGGTRPGIPSSGSAPNCAPSVSGSARQTLSVVGLTSDQRLICFDERRPSEARTIGLLDGLTGDTGLVGIDYRPADGTLIGLGNAGGIYRIDPTNSVATKKSQLSVALTGASFGIDFNPTVDRLRIVSDTGQNLRVNVDTGAATVDSGLTSTPPPAAPVTATGIVGAAYTNNDADPNTATTLYDVDSALDQVAIQAPPNAGILNPTGKLGVDTAPQVGSDIHSTLRNGTTVDVQAYASLTVGGKASFYKVTLATGAAASQGAFSTNHQVIGIAIPLNQL